MRKFFVALIATFVIMFGGVSLAAPGGQADDKKPDERPEQPEKGDKGNACPPASPNPERTPPPGCGVTDTDGDGVPDQGDNCPDDANPGQEDADEDGIGDACDDDGADDTCTDGIDNDEDDDTDDADSECSDPEDGVEDGSDEDDTCTDGLDNDGDEDTDEADSECSDPEDGVEDGSDEVENTCTDGIDNDGDSGIDGADTNDCQDGDTTEDTPVTVGAAGCTEAGGDAGLAGDTIAQQLYDGGLSALPIVEDPEGAGVISGELKAGGDGTPAEPLINEVACVVSLPAAGL